MGSRRSDNDGAARHYRLQRSRLARLKMLRVLPGPARGYLAERFLRRPGVPGPATEHVVQYLVSEVLAERKGSKTGNAISSKSADHFYDAQYRQFFSAAMGSFASSATQIVLATGSARHGRLWGRHRRTLSAVLDGPDGHGALLLVDRGTVAVPVPLPRVAGTCTEQLLGWLAGTAPQPDAVASLLAGATVPTPASNGSATTRVREHGATVLETVRESLASGRLALLALHPYDMDAMGLHITLFGVRMRNPERLIADYGLGEDEVAPYRDAATAAGHDLVFLVGGTEEIFTQCSQNLFVKHALEGADALAVQSAPDDWLTRPIDDLLALQFESHQVTVAHDGLPGVSPRNGDVGRALFVGRRGSKSYLLIPYHPGNAIHGHAAKLWSNEYSTVILSDDHTALRRVSLSGRSSYVGHGYVERRFPSVAQAVRYQGGSDGPKVPDPVYWFLTRLDSVVWERERLSPNRLDPTRAACTINAGGQGRHTKKPKYFEADTVAGYDVELQHHRERDGVQVDPTGERHRRWREELAAR